MKRFSLMMTIASWSLLQGGEARAFELRGGGRFLAAPSVEKDAELGIGLGDWAAVRAYAGQSRYEGLDAEGRPAFDEVEAYGLLGQVEHRSGALIGRTAVGGGALAYDDPSGRRSRPFGELEVGLDYVVPVAAASAVRFGVGVGYRRVSVPRDEVTAGGARMPREVVYPALSMSVTL